MRTELSVVRPWRLFTALVAAAILGALAIRSFPPAPRPFFSRTTNSKLSIKAQWQTDRLNPTPRLGERCRTGSDHLSVLLSDALSSQPLGEETVGEFAESMRQDRNGLLSVTDLAYGSNPSGEIEAVFAVVRAATSVVKVSGSVFGQADSTTALDGWAILAVRLHPPFDPHHQMIVQAFDKAGRQIAVVNEKTPRSVKCLP